MARLVNYAKSVEIWQWFPHPQKFAKQLYTGCPSMDSGFCATSRDLFT